MPLRTLRKSSATPFDAENTGRRTFIQRLSALWNLMGPRHRARVLPAVWVLTSVLILLWPAFYNGQPVMFVDSLGYIASADVGFTKLTKHSHWVHAPLAQIRQSEKSAAVPQAVHDTGAKEKKFTVGRSKYYGVLIYVSYLFGSFWVAAAVQALLLTMAIGVTLFQFFGLWWRQRWRYWAAIGCGLALTTPIAFYASFAMPDVFAGIAILAVANMFLFGDAMPLSRLIFWIAQLALASLCHNTIVMIAGLMMVSMVAYRVVKRVPLGGRAIGGCAFAIVVAIAGQYVTEFLMPRAFSEIPVTPPHITARLLADGPARQFLRDKCPKAGFAVCKFTNMPPLNDPDVFLWQRGSPLGGFANADMATQKQLGNEQYRFALAVLLYDPVGQLSASLRNFARQTVMIGLSEFNGTQALNANYKGQMPSSFYVRYRQSVYASGRMPIRLFDWLICLSTVLSLVLLVWRYAAKRVAAPREAHLRAFLGLVVAGLILNAALCGVLSTPHDRYQARVIWLLPFVTALMFEGIPRRRATP